MSAPARPQVVARGPETSSRWGQLGAEMTALVWLELQGVLGIPQSPGQGKDDRACDKRVCPSLHRKQGSLETGGMEDQPWRTAPWTQRHVLCSGHPQTDGNAEIEIPPAPFGLFGT